MKSDKCCTNDSSKLWENESAFKTMTDKIYETFESAKDKMPDFDSIGKTMNDALEKAGAKYRVQKVKLQHAFENMSDKMKGSKDEFTKSIRQFLEEKKCEADEKLK
eukprot:TRINITY_DN5368_c0_g1_i8.p1 TRINITY_DN5368_c0_g1~~TRINITY_DN5368_c0_g1_i8.p1  ORF type:complete len:106 (-),score=50.96 TRINITY_DN5368_c0_g1_i8:263-580(-)